MTFVEAFSTFFFFIAIIHVFLVNFFQKAAKKAPVGAKKSIFAFLGNVTIIFGLWLIPVLIVYTAQEGFENTYTVLTSVQLIEPFAYFVLLTIASIAPIRNLFDAMMHRFFGKRILYFWMGIILLSSILTGVFSAVPIMGLACWLFSSSFFRFKPSPKLAYFTLALLFLGISAGSTILPFNFGFMMSAINGNLSHIQVFNLFGWKVLFALLCVCLMVGRIFRDEFKKLQKTYKREKFKIKITFRELFYLALFFLAASFQQNFFWLFLILGIVVIFHKSVYRIKREKLSLYLPLAVAFFTYTLEIHGSLQKWWVLPFFENVEGLSTFFYSFFTTGLNEHVPLEALKEILPTKANITQFFAILGVLAGGGLTIIAKSANILGKLQLKKHFPHKTISPFHHLIIAIPLGLVFSFIIGILYYLGGS